MSENEVEIDMWQYACLVGLLLAIVICLVKVNRKVACIADALESPRAQVAPDAYEDPDANNLALEGWRVTMVREADDAE